MSWSPATPDRSGNQAVRYPAQAVPATHQEKHAATAHQASLHEPSPASTYGDSVSGNSVPATPQAHELNDPAILTHSLRSLHVNETQGCDPKVTAGLARFSRATAAHTPRSDKDSPPEGAPVAQTGSASSSCGSAVSSPTARHTKDGASPNAQRVSEIRTASTWRSNSDAEGFVKGNVPDQFGITGDHTQETTIVHYPREDRLGVEITADNAQAVHPPNACVFVANLASTRTDEQLEWSVTQAFSEFGKVYVKIRRDIRSMPYAFCQYENVADAVRAIEFGRGMMINGRPCRTERAKVNRSLYLSRITGGPISEDEAREVVKKYGELENVWYCSPTDKEMFRLPDGIWIMWAFFQDARDAQAGLKDDPKYRLEQPAIPADIRSRLDRSFQSPATRLNAGLSLASPQFPARRTAERNSIFVGNLPASVNQAQLREIFQACGRVRGIEIVSKPSANATGVNIFAFVEFQMEQEARIALAQEHSLEGHRLRVEIKESPEHVQQRMSSMGSAGSPRARVDDTLPEYINGAINPALAMGRALSLGLHPVNVSYIFYGADGNQSPTASINTTTPVSMSSPATLGTPIAMNVANGTVPAWPFPYHPTYYATPYSGYGSSGHADSDASVQNGTSQIYNAAISGQSVAHSYGFGNYSGLTPYVHPPQDTHAETLGQIPGHGKTQ